MSVKRIIPCLDVKEGRVVKGVEFVQLRDAGDPVELTRRYCDEGADELCFLDIAASHDARSTRLRWVERCAARASVPMTVGGGVSALKDVRALLSAGADKVAINSAAVREPALIQEISDAFGRQVLVVSIDAKRVPDHERWQVYTHGGRRETGLDAVAWAQKVAALGAGEVLLTSMDRDGTRDGYDLLLLRRVASSVDVPLIASGGVGSLEHLREGLSVGADAALAASIFHDGTHSITEAKDYLERCRIPVRPSREHARSLETSSGEP